jgi:hypothetical protein
MMVKRLIPDKDVLFLTPRERDARVRSEVAAMGNCARLIERDGMCLLREDWSDDFALFFDVPDDPSFLLL